MANSHSGPLTLTRAERARLDRAATFGEAADIALAFLRRLAAGRVRVVQICGPMSSGGRGNLEANLAYFRRCIAAAVSHGVAVFDQVLWQEALIRICDYREGDAEKHAAMLEEFYRPVLASGLIVEMLFLPGWEGSTGATWERDRATKEFSIPVADFPAEWLPAD